MEALLICEFPQLGLRFSHKLHGTQRFEYSVLIELDGQHCRSLPLGPASHDLAFLPVSAPDLASRHPAQPSPISLRRDNSTVQSFPPDPPLFQGGLFGEYDADAALSICWDALAVTLRRSWTSPYIRREPRPPPQFRWTSPPPPGSSGCTLKFEPPICPTTNIRITGAPRGRRTDYKLFFGPPTHGIRSASLAYAPEASILATTTIPDTPSVEDSLAYALQHLPITSVSRV